MRPRIVIAGGSGFLGTALIDHLHGAGYDTVVLSRSKGEDLYTQSLVWDGRTVGPWKESLEGAKAVINLAGKSLADDWSEENKREMLLSRIEPTRAIGEAISKLDRPPEVWLNASGVGAYGSRGAQVLDEATEYGDDFSAEICRQWEAAAMQAHTPRTRKVILRTGPVLGKGGGMLEPLVKVTKLFVGGHQGSGAQWIAWIHLADWCRSVIWCMEHDLEGPVNVCSPSPVRNMDLMRALRKHLHRPWAPPAPEFLLKIASVFGAPNPELVLESTRAIPRKLLDSGFTFEFPELDLALRDLLR